MKTKPPPAVKIGTGLPSPNCASERQVENELRLSALPMMRDRRTFGPFKPKERDMNQLIYLVGLIVVVLFILSFFGLR